MLRLGLQLTLRGGRDAAVRLVLTVAAVAIGVTLLLSVTADFHAYQVTSGRPCWECTQAASGHASPSESDLWDYSENIYQGRFIEDLSVAALGPRAPVVPGLAKMPPSGEYYASPALAGLLRTVPRGELGARFPGKLAGTIGYQALSGPNDLVAVVGYSPAILRTMPGTVLVDKLGTRAQTQGTTNLYRMAFGVGIVIILFPLVMLISTATRISASRREARFAAMRLVGATSRQVNVVASVEAAVTALLGAIVGTGAFLALRPALGNISLSGERFFEQDITPTALGFVAVLVVVPFASAVGAFWSLRRARRSPLGVARKVTASPPTAWRLLPVVVGVPVFVLPLALGRSDPSPALTVSGMLLIMFGLVASGSWLTRQTSRALAWAGSGASSLLAARRLSYDPKTAFRTVSGLVLAVFVGSLMATAVPALSAAQSKLGGSSSLEHVLRVPYSQRGLVPPRAAQLMAQLRAKLVGAVLLPIYVNPDFAPQLALPTTSGAPQSHGAGGTPRAGATPTTHGALPARPGTTSSAPSTGYDSIVSCAGVKHFAVLGRCRPGDDLVYANLNSALLSDNPLSIADDLPGVKPSGPVYSGTTTNLPVGTLLVETTSLAQTETARTMVTIFGATVPHGTFLSGWQQGDLEAETFGEVAQVRNDDIVNAENIVLALVVLTLLVAACSLAVTVCGGIVERKRPFALLRVTGAPISALRRVVMLESVLPLLAASAVAAATGVGVAIPLVKSLPVVKAEAGAAAPDATYYLAMGIGLVVAMVVVSVALPLLGRATSPENARFE